MTSKYTPDPECLMPPDEAEAINWAVRPTLMSVLCQIHWADWQATPPTVDMSDGEVMDIYTFLSSEGFRWSRAEINAALAELFKASEDET